MQTIIKTSIRVLKNVLHLFLTLKNIWNFSCKSFISTWLLADSDSDYTLTFFISKR